MIDWFVNYLTTMFKLLKLYGIRWHGKIILNYEWGSRWKSPSIVNTFLTLFKTRITDKWGKWLYRLVKMCIYLSKMAYFKFKGLFSRFTRNECLDDIVYVLHMILRMFNYYFPKLQKCISVCNGETVLCQLPTFLIFFYNKACYEVLSHILCSN